MSKDAREYTKRKTKIQKTLNKNELLNKDICMEIINFTLLPTKILCEIDGYFQLFEVVKMNELQNKVFIDNSKYTYETDETGNQNKRYYGWHEIHSLNYKINNDN